MLVVAVRGPLAPCALMSQKAVLGGPPEPTRLAGPPGAAAKGGATAAAAKGSLAGKKRASPEKPAGGAGGPARGKPAPGGGKQPPAPMQLDAASAAAAMGLALQPSDKPSKPPGKKAKKAAAPKGSSAAANAAAAAANAAVPYPMQLVLVPMPYPYTLPMAQQGQQAQQQQLLALQPLQQPPLQQPKPPPQQQQQQQLQTSPYKFVYWQNSTSGSASWFGRISHNGKHLKTTGCATDTEAARLVDRCAPLAWALRRASQPGVCGRAGQGRAGACAGGGFARRSTREARPSHAPLERGRGGRGAPRRVRSRGVWVRPTGFAGASLSLPQVHLQAQGPRGVQLPRVARGGG